MQDRGIRVRHEHMFASHPDGSSAVSIVTVCRRERHAAEHLAGAGGTDGLERLAAGRGRRQPIGDRHELVRVGALVAAAAHRRGDRPDRRGAVAVDAARDVAQAVGRRRPRQARRPGCSRSDSRGPCTAARGSARSGACRRASTTPAVGSNTHFCRPAVVCAAASVYVPGRARTCCRRCPRRRRTACVGLANQIPNGNAVVGLGQRRREPVQDAHVVRRRRPAVWSTRRVVGDRRGRQLRARLRQADAVRARAVPVGVDEVHGVDAVAAAALGVVDDVVRRSSGRGSCVLADLVRPCRPSWVMLKLPTRRRLARRLRRLGLRPSGSGSARRRRG